MNTELYVKLEDSGVITPIIINKGKYDIFMKGEEFLYEIDEIFSVYFRVGFMVLSERLMVDLHHIHERIHL